MNNKFFYLPMVSCLIIVSLYGCSKKAAAPMTMPPAEVGVVTVTSKNVPVVTELPGRIEAVRVAEVRARANGILLKRSFDEGSDVKEGQVLFQIDPAPLKASLDSAQAVLTRAQAVAAQSESKAKRFKSLVDAHAVSQQEDEDTQAAALQAKADVQAAQAAVESATLNLGYATVTSPIDGRIGTAKVTEGALVSQTQATELAVVTQLDPIYLDFSQSSTEMLKLKQSLNKGQLQNVATEDVKVVLLLEDGSTYSQEGKLLFSDTTVDPTTGMITMRAQFPNPDHMLLPGMFARVRLEQAVNANAITAPQRAVILGPNGSATVMIVNKDNKVEVKPVKVGAAIGDQWVISEGLQDGDSIIVEGLQKARPGSEVKPVPFK